MSLKTVMPGGSPGPGTAVQPAQDRGVVAAEYEDLVALKVEVALRGLMKNSAISKLINRELIP